MFIVMGLFAFLLVWETVGGLDKTAKLLEPWSERHAPAADEVDMES